MIELNIFFGLGWKLMPLVRLVGTSRGRQQCGGTNAT